MQKGFNSVVYKEKYKVSKQLDRSFSSKRFKRIRIKGVIEEEKDGVQMKY